MAGKPGGEIGEVFYALPVVGDVLTELEDLGGFLTVFEVPGFSGEFVEEVLGLSLPGEVHKVIDLSFPFDSERFTGAHSLVFWVSKKNER